MAGSNSDDIRWAFEVGEPVGRTYSEGPWFVVTAIVDEWNISVCGLGTRTSVESVNKTVFERQRMSFSGPVKT